MDSIVVLVFVVLLLLVYISSKISSIPQSVEEKLDKYEKRLMKLIMSLEELVDVVQTKAEKIADSLSELEDMIAKVKEATKELRDVSIEVKKNVGRANKILEHETKRLTSKVVEAINTESARQLRLIQQTLDTHIPKLYTKIETATKYAGRAAGLVYEVMQKLEELSKEIKEVKKQSTTN